MSLLGEARLLLLYRVILAKGGVDMDKSISWDELPLLLTVAETSKVIGYNQARIRELCKTKILPHIRYGRAYKIPRDNLRKWVAGCADENSKNIHQ